MNKDKIFYFLNQPFVLWFFSTILVGYISFQYNELQQNSLAQQENIRTLKKSKLEINILLQDIYNIAKLRRELKGGTLKHLGYLMAYQSTNKTSQLYSPTLQNLMLEIDTRSSTFGIEKFKERIAEQIYSMTQIRNRLDTNKLFNLSYIWNDLTEQERKILLNMPELAEEMMEYYAY